MLHLVALLTGFGGLLLEMVWLRRHGLLLGNTAEASALVLAVYLLGLGLGGLLVTRLRAGRQRPLARAALLYGGVAVLALAGEVLLQALPPLGFWAGFGVAWLVPGVPALAMGVAFPLLFAALPRGARWSPGLLVGANLLGAVLATFGGGNFAIPGLGLTRCAWLAAGMYGAAAALLALLARRGRVLTQALPRPPLPAIGSIEAAAFASGGLVLGLEIGMLRRLPFFLDGFQPTLSGVLSACLLFLALGAGLAPVLHRLFAARAAAASILLGALALALGPGEAFAPALGRLTVDSEIGFHLRILLAASVAAGPACLFLGATIPLCLVSFVHPETRAPLAGRLFFFQGVGALFGALAMGHGLPWLLPGHYFVYGIAILAGTGLIVVWRGLGGWTVVGGAAVATLALAGVTGGTIWRGTDAPVAGSRHDKPGRYRYLEHRSDSVLTASVVYDRRNHQMMLFTDEFRAAYTGSDSEYMKVLGHLPFLLRDGLARVAVVALGTGTTANAVALWPAPEAIHVVEISAAVYSLVDRFAADGPGHGAPPAPFRADPRTKAHLTDGRRFIARAAPASLDLISMEPLLPYAPGTVPLYTREFYELCRTALTASGLMVQWVPTHAMPVPYFETLLATFARSFQHHSVWLFNQSTLLVGSASPHLPALEALRGRLNAVPPAVRVDMHEAGIARAEDLIAAFVGDDVLRVCGTAAILHDDRPFIEDIGYWSGPEKLSFLPDNLAVLERLAAGATDWPGHPGANALRRARLSGRRDLARAWSAATATSEEIAVLALHRARAVLPFSVLLHGEALRARRALYVRQGLARQLDQQRIARFLKDDPGSALLWAVRARGAPRELDQHDAMLRAEALDPLIFAEWPDLRPEFVEPAAVRGPLEDLVLLPEGELLWRRVARDSPESVALRGHYRVRVAYSALDVLRQRPLDADALPVLRSILDPALFDAVLRTVQHRGGDVVAEVLPLWRSDLALPVGIEALRRGDAASRTALADALAGRRGRAELSVLGDLLLDPDAAVRRVAAVALFQSLGNRITFDPQWDAARRAAAVQELRQWIEQQWVEAAAPSSMLGAPASAVQDRAAPDREAQGREAPGSAAQGSAAQGSEAHSTEEQR